LGAFIEGVKLIASAMREHKYLTCTGIFIFIILFMSFGKAIEISSPKVFFENAVGMLFDMDEKLSGISHELISSPPKSSWRTLWLYIEFGFGCWFYYIIFYFWYHFWWAVLEFNETNTNHKPSNITLLVLAIAMVMVFRVIYILIMVSDGKRAMDFGLTFYGGWGDLFPLLTWVIPILSHPIKFLMPLISVFKAVGQWFTFQGDSVKDALGN